jgi:hypothetical protein
LVPSCSGIWTVEAACRCMHSPDVCLGRHVSGLWLCLCLCFAEFVICSTYTASWRSGLAVASSSSCLLRQELGHQLSRHWWWHTPRLSVCCTSTLMFFTAAPACTLSAHLG